MRSFGNWIGSKAPRLGIAAAFMGLIGWASMPVANATVITFYNAPSTQTGERFTLGCGSATGDCAGLLEALETQSSDGSAGVYSQTIGGLFSLGNSGSGTQASFANLNAVGGPSSDFSTGTTTNGNGKNSFRFSTSADYFLIKIGNKGGLSTALLHNLSGGDLDLFFTGLTGGGNGFSHYTAFGDATPPTPVAVPEPSSLGILGLGLAAIGVVVGFGRKRRSQRV